MTRPTVRKRRKRVVKSPEERRADILRASREVFETIGFADAKIVDIAEAADIGKGTFYAYFETKDHALGALWEEYVDAFVATTEEILARGEAWWPTIDELLITLIEHAVDNAGLHRIVYGSANAKALELCKESNARVVDLMCDFVSRGATAGAFRCHNPDWAFRMVYHAADGLLDDLIARRTPIDTAEVTRSVLELAHRTLGDHDLKEKAGDR
ncbi:TetR/AcrR family transcriptional regulator [Streptomyces barkulensis]|uniref:TetR/AcrR family transcriptional regulator n=1 Tax=Streptomyces barkulensis TaxID=1257026 RepID=UPI000C6D5AD5|nr:TetR/AcrR family transcriptional regulator [Streptomyces barkulensis]